MAISICHLIFVDMILWRVELVTHALFDSKSGSVERDNGRVDINKLYLWNGRASVANVKSMASTIRPRVQKKGEVQRKTQLPFRIAYTFVALPSLPLS